MRSLLLLLAAAVALPSVMAQTAGQRAQTEGQFVKALTAMQTDQDSVALRALDRVLASAPDDPTVLSLRSEVAARLGDAPDAVFYARRAAGAAPDRPDVLRNLATALRAAGQPADAADALAQAVAVDPADLDTQLAVADLAAERGDAEAEAEALRAIVRVGDSVGARLRLSVLAEEAGDTEAALAQAEAAARLSRSDPAVRRRLAALRGQTPPPPPAADGSADLAALRAAVDADPGRIDLWLQLLDAAAAARAPGTGAIADDALLLFPTVPAVLASAAHAYVAADRGADASDAARRGLAALDLIGDALPPDEAEALRRRLDALLPD